MEDFINDAQIEDILEKARNPERNAVEALIDKAKTLKGLTPHETAVLLQVEDQEMIDLICRTAKEIKEAIYGNRLVLFAPYTSPITAPTTACIAASARTTRNLIASH